MFPAKHSYHSIVDVSERDSDQVSMGGIEDFQTCRSASNALRTQLLLLDYKQFKAARIIQKFFRGYHVRNMIKKKKAAASVIQLNWRQHTYRRKLIIMAQELTQESVLFKFNLSVLKIQAFFRGWWSRKYVNNMLFLKHKRLQSLEDILTAFAFKLHQIMHVGQLPGFMDFRKEHPEILENILSTLNYRFFNRYVSIKYVKSKTIHDACKRSFRKSIEWTWVPYPSYNHHLYCRPMPVEDDTPKEYGMREYDIIHSFVKRDRCIQEYRLHNEKKKVKKPSNEFENERLFCRDLAKSMRFWRDCPFCYKVKVSDSFMGHHFDSFLNCVKLYVDENYVFNCNCRRDIRNDEISQDCT